MEPNQYQSPRTDYQAVPVDRPQAYAGSVAVEQTAPASQTIPVTVVPAATPPVEQPVVAQPAPVAPSQPAAPALDQAAPLAEPLTTAPPPPLPNNQSVFGQVTAGATPSAPESATAAQPWQTPILAPQKPAIWKTQKFWRVTSVSVFVLLLVGGVLVGYKATHHKPDTILPVTAVTKVDTSSDIKTVGATAADQAANKQRQEAILSLRSYIEAYYVNSGKYPTNAQMADSNWVLTNLKGVTAQQLKDPAGTTGGLLNVPTKDRYAYQAGADATVTICDNTDTNCNFYQLTAILSDGSHYVKTALQ